MIALHFSIPLDKVEEMLITDYRLCVFTIINNSKLMNGLSEFDYLTPDEKEDELIEQIENAKARGLSF